MRSSYKPAIGTGIVIAVVSFVVFAQFRQPETPQTKPAVKIKQFKDPGLGVTFSINEVYVRQPDTPAANVGGQAAINFERSRPQALFTIRYEMGLAKTANLLKKSLLEYVKSNIEQFFPSRYKDYKSLVLRDTTINGKEGVEHIFTYSDQDGNPIESDLLIVPHNNDSAYYLIFQSHQKVFTDAKPDLDIIKKSFKPSGPSD